MLHAIWLVREFDEPIRLRIPSRFLYSTSLLKRSGRRPEHEVNFFAASCMQHNTVWYKKARLTLGPHDCLWIEHTSAILFWFTVMWRTTSYISAADFTFLVVQYLEKYQTNKRLISKWTLQKAKLEHSSKNENWIHSYFQKRSLMFSLHYDAVTFTCFRVPSAKIGRNNWIFTNKLPRMYITKISGHVVSNVPVFKP